MVVIWNPFIGDWSQNEKISENEPPLELKLKNVPVCFNIQSKQMGEGVQWIFHCGGIIIMQFLFLHSSLCTDLASFACLDSSCLVTMSENVANSCTTYIICIYLDSKILK